MAVKIFTTANFTEEVLQSTKPVVVDFWASWCGPCKMIAPIVEELAEEYADVVLGKVNVDEEPSLAQRYGIMSIPTLVLIQNGEVAKKCIGLQSKEDLKEFIG
ncbi:MAG: thioredoxin [Lachnospiraceae bacterium]